MGSKIEIAVVVDDAYVQHLGVMLASLFANNVNTKFRVNVFTYSLSKTNRKYLQDLIEHNKSHVNFYNIHWKGHQKYLKISDHISKTAYNKILIPNILKNISKVLYLDSDLLILDSIAALWNAKMDNYTIAAIPDPSSNREAELGYPKKFKYFNSGVMLINIKRWNKEKITSKILKYIKYNSAKLKLWDQDALNKILFDEWKRLPAVYNFQTAMYANTSQYTKNHKPIIVHFSSSSKPWQLRCNHPMKNLYWDYLKITVWKNYKMRDINLKSLLLHFIPLRLEFFIAKIKLLAAL